MAVSESDWRTTPRIAWRNVFSTSGPSGEPVTVLPNFSVSEAISTFMTEASSLRAERTADSRACAGSGLAASPTA
jgi:hypothetical protein